MRILFLHGWHSVPGGVKPTYLRNAGHEVINPKLDDDDFDAAVRTAQAEYDRHRPSVIVASSRGGAVALNIDSADTPLVLLCPAWKHWGTFRRLKPNSLILHSRQDDVIPFEESEELLAGSGLPRDRLLEVGTDHRLADPEPLARMLEACEQLVPLVEVTVSYLEMREHVRRSVSPPREDLQILHVRTPAVRYYRYLYDAVGRDYHWLSRRKMSDESLAALLADPGTQVHVLHVAGSPAGLAELNAAETDDVELVQFGLMSDYIGQGLGTWFLQNMIDIVWQRQPRRFWLHTCTLDHPAALAMYRKAGFVDFKSEQIRREL